MGDKKRFYLGQRVRHNCDPGTFLVVGIDLEADTIEVVPEHQWDSIEDHTRENYCIRVPIKYSIRSCRPAG